MPRRILFNVHSVIREHIGNIAYGRPVVNPIREVMQPAVLPSDQGDVVSGVRMLKPSGDLKAVVTQYLLGEMEFQYLLQKTGIHAHVLTGDEDVI